MEPTLLALLFAGLTIISTWFSVPLTTLNPQRPVADRLAGAFQLTIAAQGVSSLYCRFNPPKHDFSPLLNRTLPHSDPTLGATQVFEALEPTTFLSTPTEAPTSSLIPIPTVPFGGAERIIPDNFVVEDSRDYPEWVLGAIVLLVIEHMRRNPNAYTFAASFVVVQVVVNFWFFGQLKKGQSSGGERQQTPEGAALELIRSQLADEQARSKSAASNLDEVTRNFQSFKNGFQELAASVNGWPEKFAGLEKKISDQIATQAGQFDTHIEQLRGQLGDLSSASSANAANAANAVDPDILQHVQEMLEELTMKVDQKPWELKHNEHALALKFVDERLEKQSQSLLDHSEKASNRFGRVQKDLDQWKEATTMRSEFTGLEARIDELRGKVDADHNILVDEMSSLTAQQNSLHSDFKLAEQFVNQLKADQPWKRGSSLTEKQLAAVDERIKGAVTKVVDMVLPDAMKNSTDAVKDTLSTAWQRDLNRAELSRNELQKSVAKELDSVTNNVMAKVSAEVSKQVSKHHEEREKRVELLKGEFDRLFTHVKSLEVRPAGNSAQSDELQKVKEMARDAENSAIGAHIAIEDMKAWKGSVDGRFEGFKSIIKTLNSELQQLRDPAKSKFGAGNEKPLAPASSREAKVVDVPRAQSKSDEKGKQKAVAPQDNTWPAIKPPTASTFPEFSGSGLGASMWAPKPAEPKPTKTGAGKGPFTKQAEQAGLPGSKKSTADAASKAVPFMAEKPKIPGLGLMESRWAAQTGAATEPAKPKPTELGAGKEVVSENAPQAPTTSIKPEPTEVKAEKGTTTVQAEQGPTAPIEPESIKDEAGKGTVTEQAEQKSAELEPSKEVVAEKVEQKPATPTKPEPTEDKAAKGAATVQADKAPATPTEPKSTKDEASQSAAVETEKPKTPGLMESRWAPTAPAEPQSTTGEASKSAAAEPEKPKPQGLMESRWAIPAAEQKIPGLGLSPGQGPSKKPGSKKGKGRR